jgi:hypothetical protein
LINFKYGNGFVHQTLKQSFSFIGGLHEAMQAALFADGGKAKYLFCSWFCQ